MLHKIVHVQCMCTLQEGPSLSDDHNAPILQSDEETIPEMDLDITPPSRKRLCLRERKYNQVNSMICVYHK